VNYKKIKSQKELKELLEKSYNNKVPYEIYEATEYANVEWSVHEGDLELDSYSKVQDDLIVCGDLIIKEPLAEITSELIVCGTTKCNAMLLDEGNDVFLLGGVQFNVALISCLGGPFRIINNPQGAFMYNDADSVEINNTQKVSCYIDHVYAEGHGDAQNILKDKYFSYDDPDDLEDYFLDNDALISDLRVGESIFKDSTNIGNFVEVQEYNLDDRDTIISLLKKEAAYFKKLTDNYKKDKELISIAVENNSEVFKYVPQEIKEDRDFVLSLLKKEGRLFEYLSDELKKDKELVLIAVASDGYVLDDLHETLKADKEIVFEAVKSHPKSLAYAHDSMKDDMDIASYIIDNCIDAFKYVSPVAKTTIFNDKELMIKLLKSNLDYILYLKDEWKDDKEFMLKLILESPSPNILKYASDKLKADRDLVLEAIKHNGYALCYASTMLQQDKELFMLAIKDNGAVWQTVGKKYFKNNKEVVLSLLEEGILYPLMDLSDALKRDEDILKISKKYE